MMKLRLIDNAYLSALALHEIKLLVEREEIY
jgi:hypothetical protein